MLNPIESAIAKVAGVTAAFDARFHGLTGVFTTLASQHHALDVRLLSLRSATDYGKREQLWRRIRIDLITHEQAELLEIYPVLARYPATQELTQHHASQSAELERLVAAVDLVGCRGEAWQPVLAHFIAKFHEHVQAEETLLFPQAQAALGVTLSKQLERPFLRAKELAEQRLLA